MAERSAGVAPQARGDPRGSGNASGGRRRVRHQRLVDRVSPELRDRATSLESELGRSVDRYALLVETLAALARRYDDLLAGRFDAILDAWRRLAPAASGARVTWTTLDNEQSGVTAGIDDQGALLVRVGDRMERINSGEVTWL